MEISTGATARESAQLARRGGVDADLDRAGIDQRREPRPSQVQAADPPGLLNVKPDDHERVVALALGLDPGR